MLWFLPWPRGHLSVFITCLLSLSSCLSFLLQVFLGSFSSYSDSIPVSVRIYHCLITRNIHTGCGWEDAGWERRGILEWGAVLLLNPAVLSNTCCSLANEGLVQKTFEVPIYANALWFNEMSTSVSNMGGNGVPFLGWFEGWHKWLQSTICLKLTAAFPGTGSWCS